MQGMWGRQANEQFSPPKRKTTTKTLGSDPNRHSKPKRQHQQNFHPQCLCSKPPPSNHPQNPPQVQYTSNYSDTLHMGSVCSLKARELESTWARKQAVWSLLPCCWRWFCTSLSASGGRELWWWCLEQCWRRWWCSSKARPLIRRRFRPRGSLPCHSLTGPEDSPSAGNCWCPEEDCLPPLCR